MAKEVIYLEYPKGFIIDLFKQMAMRQLKKEELIIHEYNRIKNELNRVPSRLDLFNLMDGDIYQLCRSESKINPFRDHKYE